MLSKLKEPIKKIPVLGKIAIKTMKLFSSKRFVTSSQYWENRYRSGGNSGAGSYNNLAEYKGEVINAFVAENNINSVIEYGCGDGNQLKYFNFSHYTGYDVSETVIKKCKETYKNDQSKVFKTLREYQPDKAELTMSLDVIYHLVEDDVFFDHMTKLFDTSKHFVIIYSSNSDNHENNGVADHVRHRKFSDWIERERKEFKLIKHLPNKYAYNGDGSRSSYADFYFYEKTYPDLQ